MLSIQPGSPAELAQVLAEAAGRRNGITLGGNFSKQRMGGPISEAAVTISTARLSRLLQYEPRDLTVSVEAGMPYRDLTRILAERRQMLPLDPPFADEGTIGGVLAANLSGPRRRLYGTARDMVIGMTFATLAGKLVQTGGMVVKNVAGLDMGKLLIGSFGTLGAMASVNFKVHPMPEGTRTFVRRCSAARDAVAARDSVLTSVLQPAALDLRKTPGGYELLVQAGGSPLVLNRYAQELAGYEALEGAAEEELWLRIRETTRDFLITHEDGAVVRYSCGIRKVGEYLERLAPPAIARAGSGVVYGYFPRSAEAGGQGLIEFAPQALRQTSELWPGPGDDFEMMKKIKRMLDPDGLLNRARLYGRI